MPTKVRNTLALRTVVYVALMVLLFAFGSVSVATVIGAVGLTVIFALTVRDALRTRTRPVSRQIVGGGQGYSRH